jgi:hypothetical protein
VTDVFSRYLLGCQALSSTAAGLPARIRTDNGVPFATTTLARLSKLSAWWARLGVLLEFVEPGRPDQNGRHERMRRPRRARPPAASPPSSGASTSFATRPITSARMRRSISRRRRRATRPLGPGDAGETASAGVSRSLRSRYVSANGGIRWNRRWVNVSTVCIGEYVGLEEVDDGIWNVYFGPLKLGRLLEQHMRIEDAYG